MKKSILALIVLFLICVPKVNAKTKIEDTAVAEQVVAQDTKYYKTIYALSDSEVMNRAGLNDSFGITTEISEEEYLRADDGDNINASYTTEYKKLVATISYYSKYYYKYKSELTWRKIPATRSYDIIAIGHNASVKLAGGVDFKQSYCTTDGNCYTSEAGYWEKVTSNGYGAMFHLPTASLTSLSQSVSILVEKTNSSTTIYSQDCVADYAHAQKTISYADAKNFKVGIGGLILDQSILDYYDSIEEPRATWTGTW